MKRILTHNSTLAGFPAFAVSGTIQAQQKGLFELAGAEAKCPPGDFKPAPGKMHIRFAKLAFPGGYPTEESLKKVYDELDLQRATQL